MIEESKNVLHVGEDGHKLKINLYILQKLEEKLQTGIHYKIWSSIHEGVNGSKKYQIDKK